MRQRTFCDWWALLASWSEQRKWFIRALGAWALGLLVMLLWFSLTWFEAWLLTGFLCVMLYAMFNPTLNDRWGE